MDFISGKYTMMTAQSICGGKKIKAEPVTKEEDRNHHFSGKRSSLFSRSKGTIRLRFSRLRTSCYKGKGGDEEN